MMYLSSGSTANLALPIIPFSNTFTCKTVKLVSVSLSGHSTTVFWFWHCYTHLYCLPLLFSRLSGSFMSNTPVFNGSSALKKGVRHLKCQSFLPDRLKDRKSTRLNSSHV